MKKISIVIPCYGTEKYVGRCLDSLISQTYKNIQIVAVNDCSKGNMHEILEQYSKKDSRIIVVDNKENQGLYKTRIIGSKNCDGDYISFVDSDDFVEKDYYRTLLKNSEKNESDIVIASVITSNQNGNFIYNLLDKTNNRVLENKNIYQEYFLQEGTNYRWHIVCGKLINKKIWDKALPYYEKMDKRITMTEDFIFSSISLFFAKKISFCDDAHYYYYNNDNQSTSLKNITLNKVKQNINDILESYSYVKKFLKEKKVLKEYEQHLNNWECYYLNMHYNLLTDSIASKKEKEEIINHINSKVDYSEYIKNTDVEKLGNYYSAISEYDDGLEKIKDKICDENIKIVSFDLFDTLVVRPFYRPSDMFQLLDKEFITKSKCNPVIRFSKIRKETEMFLREEKLKEGIEEITLKEIYKRIEKEYKVENSIIDYMMKKEIEMELEFCKKRNTGFDLYSLAKELGKKVIVTTDIYLDEKTIKELLKRNNYEFDEVYISSVLRKTKSTGSLFDYVISKEEISSLEILHIGDNIYSDINKAKEKNINTAHLPRTIDKMMDTNNCGTLFQYFQTFNIDVRPYMDNFGVRCSIAVVANKFFDNPFVHFCEESTFNANPFLVGYYALGMNLLSVGKWLLADTKKKNITKLSFMARDGLIPLRATEMIKNNTSINKNIELKYIYISRKALMPLVIDSKLSLSILNTYLTSYMKLTPLDLQKQLKAVLKDTTKDRYIKFVNKNNYKEDEKFDDYNSFLKFLELIYDEYYDKNKYLEYYNITKSYLEEFYSDNSATFDIGYSGKPEALITKIINKPIHTYFIHTNSSEGFNNSYLSEYELNTFFEYKPTLTGTFRELLYSDIGPSCVGYERDKETNKAIPVFGKKESYTNFNINMIESIQNSALEFVDDFTKIFSNYFDSIDFNKFYMSLPYEYFLHYSKYFDTVILKNILFEDNVNNKIELLEFVRSEFDYYRNNYCKEENNDMDSIKKSIINEGYGKLPKSRLLRITHYTLFDRKELKNKYMEWKDKTNKPLELPSNKVKRGFYYLIFDKKKFTRRIFKRK